MARVRPGNEAREEDRESTGHLPTRHPWSYTKTARVLLMQLQLGYRLTDETGEWRRGSAMSRPQSFCVVPPNPASALEFSSRASRTEQESSCAQRIEIR